ncbi:MAG: glycosyltransferase family 39 protein [Bryobacteraceae bacterium]
MSRVSKKSKNGGSFAQLAIVFAVASLLSAAAVWFCWHNGYTLYYGDAESHLNHARRVWDSRTPGYDQLGTVWLPLPHLLVMPLAAVDHLWRSGLAGAIPSAASFVVGAVFFFATVRRLFGAAAAAASLGILATNPNLLYLQSTPMNEPIFFACFAAVLYFTVRGSAVGAGLAALAGTLTRYEGWFLIPFVALYFLVTAKGRRLRSAAVFCILASIGPAAWLAHNYWYSGNFLEFYNGPSSPRVIQGMAPYPGRESWAQAWQYYSAAVVLCIGWPALALAGAGVAAAAIRRVAWPLALLALPGVFYIWSMRYSGGTPIFVPNLWPNSYYNTRYGLVLLPLAALAAGALVTFIPSQLRKFAVALIVLAGASPWLARPPRERCITWTESEVNSVARRAWTAQAADILRARYGPGDGVFTTFGDVTGVFRTAGIPLRKTLTWDNWPHWPAAAARPDLFLWERWAVAVAGDPVQSAILKSQLRGPHYTLEKRIIVAGAPVIEIYRREVRLPEKTD